MHPFKVSVFFPMQLLLAVFSYTSVVAEPARQPNARQPNVLFIAVDDLNDWVGALGGHPQARTPNIDRLAARGLLFTRAYCSAPGCNASRTSLLMGLRPSTTGIYQNAHDWRQTSLRTEAVNLPRHFHDQGYTTLGAGKLFHAHTFFDSQNLSGYSDPDAWDDYFPSLNQQMPKELTPSAWPVNTKKDFYGGHFDWSPIAAQDHEMADGQVVAWAKQQLQKEHDQPLFLAVGIYRPHVPWYVPQKYFDRFPLESVELPKTLASDLDDIPEAALSKTRKAWHDWIVDSGQWKEGVQGYLASLSFTDQMVGDLMEAFDSGPLADNTIVILWGDHGYHLGEKHHWEKFALWEDSTHVPLIVIAPGLTKPATKCASPVSLLDIYPTLTELCQLPSPRQELEGKSLMDLLKNPDAGSDRVAITTQGKDNHSVRSARYRYIRYADSQEELYDHDSDPHEWYNLADNEQTQAIRKGLASHLPETSADPVVVPKDER